ncbi:MAG: SGNH/GDSL hydrolase family protein [Gammaproteobacteria bacterium]|nr:SGNH/GDSL hydrolase family protein [Gammaproteobacteria bacterium]
MGTEHPHKSRFSCLKKTQVSLWLVLLLLLTSGLLNGLFLYLLHQSFTDLHFARIFPLGYPPAIDVAPQAAVSVDLAIYGDSRAYHWRPTKLVQGGSIANLAHGGQSSSQLRLQLETETVVRSCVAIAQFGINDLHPLGALSPWRDQIRRQTKENVLRIRDLLLERSKILVLTTVMPPGQTPWTRKPFWDPSTDEYIIDLNDVISHAAQHERVILLDAYAILAASNGKLRPDYVDEDFFLHLNDLAYSHLDSKLQERVGGMMSCLTSQAGQEK